MSSTLANYLSQNSTPNPGFIAYLAALEQVASVSPDVAKNIVGELADQRSNLKMIASENYCSLPTQLAMGNLLTDKYAEGIPDHRFYAGCDNVDAIESQAAKLACDLFGADHAYVQPHSGADANMVAFWAILSGRVQDVALEKMGKKSPFDLSTKAWDALRTQLGNQRLLGLDLSSGGHLTHGYRINVSGRMFEAHAYTVNKESGLIDYDEVRDQARAVKPLILLSGYSAYPRKINFRIFREIADEVGAVLWWIWRILPGWLPAKFSRAILILLPMPMSLQRPHTKPCAVPEGVWFCVRKNLPNRSIRAAQWCSAVHCPM